MAPFSAADSAADSSADASSPSPSESATTEPPDGGLPRWITDDDRLRDEGVVFGLGGSEEAIRRKVDTIRRAFEMHHARVDRQRRALSDALSDARAERDRLQDDIAEHERRIESPDEPHIDGGQAADVAPHYFLRYLVGLALALGLCALNYVLIYELVAPAFEQPWYVAAGVLMAGMFALFQPSSLLYNNDDDQGLLQDAPAELWKQRVSEFGVPLAAALFAVVWRLGEMAWYESAIAFLFVFMLFLFGGKLFLSMIPQLSIVTRNVLRDRRIRRDRSERRDAIRAIRRDELPAADRRIDAIRTDLAALPTADEIDARCEHAVSLFTSEVELARNTREQRSLDTAQIHAITRA